MTDDRIIALSAAFLAGHDEVMRLGEADPSRRAAIVSDAHDAVAEISATPAVTLAGWRAKARVLARLDGDCPELAESLARDILKGDPD